MTAGALEGPRGAWARHVERHRAALIVLAAAATTTFTLVVLGPLATERGPDMDEGAVLAYADLVRAGAVPHRDFLTFYGPGNPWLVAGAFEVLGADIRVERAIALLYRLLIALALFALAWRLAGLLAAALAGVVAVAVMADGVVWAYATYGALGFGTLGLVLMASAADRPGGRRQHLILLSAGLTGGFAALMRFELAPVILISALPLLALVSRRSRVWYGVGFVATAGLYLPHLAVVGPSRTARVMSDLVASSGARRLPVPTPWDYPGNLLAAALVAMCALGVVGALRVWRRRGDVAGHVLLAATLFGAGTLPYAFARLDGFHIVPVAIAPLALVPALVLVAARSLPVGRNGRAALAATLAAVTLVSVATFRDLELRPVRANPPRLENAGRAFYVDDDSLPAQRVVTELERRSAVGESLFVGPQDLRLADYNPTYLYFLLPKLVPASFYLEMNPNTANREGSGLPDELRRADWLVLTTEFQGEDWWGPSPRLEYGPTEPNRIVRDLFCLRLRSGEYRLYERCDRAAGA